MKMDRWLELDCGKQNAPLGLSIPKHEEISSKFDFRACLQREIADPVRKYEARCNGVHTCNPR
jgi:hypothetical protein